MNQFVTQGAPRLKKETFFLCSTATLFFFSAVLPNSFHKLTGALLLTSALLAAPFLRITRPLSALFIIFFASALITVTYVLIGQHSGAPITSAYQTLIIYIASPFLWIIVSASTTLTLRDSQIQKYIVRITGLCIISIFIFFYIYLFVNPSIATFFQEVPNVDIRDGQVAATMHVYGSLIFLSAAFFSAPGIARQPKIRWALLSAILIAALTSGRHALMLSIMIGVILGILIRATQIPPHRLQGNKTLSRAVSSLIVAACATALFAFGANSLGLDIYLILSNLIGKIGSGGGAERTEQFFALIEGISSSNALGVGHGIGVDYLRSEEHPWRYELTWVATLLRVGLVGSLLYLAPFIFYGFFFVKKLVSRQLSNIDIFMFSGLTSSLVASATNPYIESFMFQWMYIYPVVHFFMRRNTRRHSKEEIALDSASFSNTTRNS